MSDDIYYHQGIPSDLLTSDYADDRRIKVDAGELISAIVDLSTALKEANSLAKENAKYAKVAALLLADMQDEDLNQLLNDLEDL